MSKYPIKKLSEVCLVIAGQSPEGKYYNQLKEGLPFYQGKKEFGEKYIGKPTVWTTNITKVAIEGDILMSVRAPVGPINFATQEICIGRGLAAIRTLESMNKDYLFYFLLSIQDKISGNIGAVFDSINKKQIEDLNVPVPSLAEQSRIVAHLDAVRAETERLEKLYTEKLASLDELKKSVLQEAFS